MTSNLSNTVSTIVFDLGNVLVRWNPRNLYRKIFADTDRMEWFLGHICTPEWNDSMDGGLDYSLAVQELAKKYPEWKSEIEIFDSRWEEMFEGPILENVAILKELKKENIPVYAISNWSAEKFTPAMKLFPFFNDFDGMVISGHEKVRKPQPEIFQIFLTRYNKRAEDCLFIDDLEKNTDAAKKLGFKIHHFTDSLKLQEDLRFQMRKPVSFATGS